MGQHTLLLIKFKNVNSCLHKIHIFSREGEGLSLKRLCLSKPVLTRKWFGSQPVARRRVWLTIRRLLEFTRHVRQMWASNKHLCIERQLYEVQINALAPDMHPSQRDGTGHASQQKSWSWASPCSCTLLHTTWTVLGHPGHSACHMWATPSLAASRRN